MTQDEIIRMAREAGAMFDHMTWVERDLAPVFERFAALVAAHAKQEYIDSVYEQHRETMFSNKDLGMLVDAVKAEREACAKVCDDMANNPMAGVLYSWKCAAAIRARKFK